MEKQATNYVIDAIGFLRANLNPLLLLSFIGLAFSVTTSSKEHSTSGLFLPMFIVMIFYPLVYGRYTEIIQGNKIISYYQIFNKHWFNFFVVSLIIGSPGIIISLLSPVIGKSVVVAKTAIWLLTEIMTIYIVPLVFLLNEKILSISLGIKCLLGNFRYSLPLLVVTLLPSILSLIVRNPDVTSEHSVYSIFGNYLFWIINLFLDFIVFVAATLILKKKLSMAEGSHTLV